jgi:beta-galactosidase
MKHILLKATVAIMLFTQCGFLMSQSPRVIESLNKSNWKFIRQDIANAEKANFDDSKWLKISIPHDWNGGIDGVHNDVFKGPSMYLGTGTYRSTFKVDEKYKNKRVSIKFEAVSLVADVWLNGSYIGKHRGGYTAFSLDITKDVLFGKENILAVKASNANDSTLAPWMKNPYGFFPFSSDYAVYGGIYRDVWLVINDALKIESETHSTSSVSEKSGIVNINTSIRNDLKQETKASLKTSILDKTGKEVKVINTPVTVAANATANIAIQVNIEKPTLWSPESPYLYKTKSELIVNNKTIDVTESNLGFRYYTLKNGTGFKLNGKGVFLHGVNRHQDRQGFGYALTNEQHLEDVELIKSLGFNFLRHAHYPADEAVLDACDRLGIMVWLEIPVSTCIAPNNGFLESSKVQLVEMITEHYNHPCVIVWGLGNESDRSGAASEAFCNYFFKELNILAHKTDSTRPTTGCNFNIDSNHAIPDVYAPQDWLGWYSGNLKDYSPSKMIGEYGADSHIPSHDENFVSNSNKQPWTQETACTISEYKVSLGESRKDSFPGQLVWVAFDFASPRTDRATNPIPFMNQKGLVAHDHKTLKDIAYFYRSYYTSAEKAPMVYIVSHTWENRISKPSVLNIWAYSNCDSVVLYNGSKNISFGSRQRTAGPRNDTRFQWDNINITDALLIAEGYYKGKIVATDKLTFSPFDPKAK